MPGHAYERVPDNENILTSGHDGAYPSAIPTSPPPSFRSRTSSPASRRVANVSNADSTLEDTFDDGLSDEDNDNDDRQRLIRRTGPSQTVGLNNEVDDAASDARVSPSQESAFPASHIGHRSVNLATLASSNDGVFANLNAKPESGGKSEEQPPSYEQAAADATPPYWETTILAPGMVSDEVFIDGLPVGSFFSFAWNAIISMAFQLVGFLLTYLLHTTHAARNGSRAGLGVTLINWGFTMKAYTDRRHNDGGQKYGQPPNPNDHDFDPSVISDSTAAAVAGAGREDQSTGNFPASIWLSYVVMILGWIILIKALSDFIKARRHEQLILQSPERGLNVPVVAEGENLESVV